MLACIVYSYNTNTTDSSNISKHNIEIFQKHPLKKSWKSLKFLLNQPVWNVKTWHLMHKVQECYNTCTCKSSICNSSGDIQEKSNTRWNSTATKIDDFLNFRPRWMLMYIFKNHHVYDQTQGSSVVFPLFYKYFY